MPRTRRTAAAVETTENVAAENVAAVETTEDVVAVEVSTDDAVSFETAEPETETPEQPAAQFSLLPNERPEGRSANVALARIISEDRPMEVPAELVESIRRLGVLQSVALIQQGRGEDARFVIAAGRRRVAASRLAGLVAVPAIIFPSDTPAHVAAAMTLTENATRRANPVSELEAIEEMVAAGATPDRIATDLRIPMTVLRRRMRLANLIPEFRAALLEGRINATICQDIARHDANEQQVILGVFEENGRVTAADLRRIREARAGAMSLEEAAEQSTRGTAAERQIDETLRSALPSGEGWAVVRAALEAAERAIPANPDDATEAFMSDLAALIERVNRHAPAGA